MSRLVALVLITACSDEARAPSDLEIRPSVPQRLDGASLLLLERELRELDKQIATTTTVATSGDPTIQQSAKLQLVGLHQKKAKIENRIAAAKKIEAQCKNDPQAPGCSR